MNQDTELGYLSCLFDVFGHIKFGPNPTWLSINYSSTPIDYYVEELFKKFQVRFGGNIITAKNPDALVSMYTWEATNYHAVVALKCMSSCLVFKREQARKIIGNYANKSDGIHIGSETDCSVIL